MASYSPFDRSLTALQVEDLAALKHVGEGWYVEYKREMPNAASVAKSVSAFANTYGGWLFYGIQEKSKDEPVAGSFPGIPRAAVDAGLQRLRQAVAGMVAPSPHFDTKVLWGPCDDIGLADEHAVICVQVPSSTTAPHVHRFGQIYRRVADGSEPKAENDRFVLDNLWRRGDKLRESYKAWVEREIEFSKGERKKPYLRVMFAADLWGERDGRNKLSLEEVRAVLGQERGLVSTTPFDTVHANSTGFLGRQIEKNDPQFLGLTWRFDHNLTSDIIIPIHHYYVDFLDNLSIHLDGYEHVEWFIDLLKRRNYKSPDVVDLNNLFNVITATVETQRRLLRANGWEHGFYAKVQVLNCWRTTPFLDVRRVLERFERHGVPMCLDSITLVPPNSDPDSFLKVAAEYTDEEEIMRIYVEAIRIFGLVAAAFGVPEWLDTPDGSGQVHYHTDLQNAGLRAASVHSRQTATG